MKAGFWRQMRDRFTSPRHPSFVQLLDWHEGELEERWLVWTTRHVLACPECRKEAERIRRVLDRSSVKLAETPAEREQLHHEGYLRLVARLRPSTPSPSVATPINASSFDDQRSTSTPRNGFSAPVSAPRRTTISAWR